MDERFFKGCNEIECRKSEETWKGDGGNSGGRTGVSEEDIRRCVRDVSKNMEDEEIVNDEIRELIQKKKSYERVSRKNKAVN